MPLLKKWKEENVLWGIWKVEETLEELRAMLLATFPYEQELQGLRAESRKLEYVAVRVLLLTLCGEEKQIVYHPSGKPLLADGSYRITISHTKGYVAVGLSLKQDIGIDIEYISNRVNKITSRFLRSDEHADSLEKKLLHWSAKETMYKILGETEVDFIAHLQISSFVLYPIGCFKGVEYRTPMQACFRIRYMVGDDFVCTWCSDYVNLCR